MGKSFYTFIVMPHASPRLHKLKLPVRALYILAAIGILSFFVAVGLGFQLRQNGIQSRRLRQAAARKHRPQSPEDKPGSRHPQTWRQNQQSRKRFAKNSEPSSKATTPPTAAS